MSQIKIGAILSYLSIMITTIIALIYTPIIIRLLGQSEYGLYSMIGSISAYLSIMDLGLGNAIVRYISRNRAIGNKEAEAKLNGMFLLFYSMIGALTIIVGFIVYSTVDNVFGSTLNTMEIKKAKIMVIVIIINFALSFPLAIFGSILQAYEKFVFVKLVSIIRSLAVPLMTLPFLFSGFGSISMVVVSSIVNIICLLFNVYYCFRKLRIKVRFGKPDYSLIKEIIGYSFFVFLGIIVDQINWNTGQIILGATSGTVVVAVFAIAIQFVRLYLQFSTSISGLFLPRVSIMVANNATSSDLSNIMIKYGRVQYIILAYILSGFILYGREFIELWAGSNYISAYYMVLIIMIPITIPLIQNIGLSILQAKNLQGFRSVVLIIIAILNVSISIPLSKNLGGIGVALGTGISYIVGNGLIMNLYYHRKIGLKILDFWKDIIFLSIPVIIALTLGFGLDYTIPKGNLSLIIIKIMLFSLGYFCLMWFKGFNEYERKLFKFSIGNK
ncbi:oligosaccharide flippase family protein [Rossellomorea marisflavi]|uniref:oligosaccharide flippase family protein n=1 Tax=Rossellomorea marisflavi TaxID=189381 RepID=UPI00064F79E5|nr:oligosaccharide flippase family protein [Rossellomorea marisflavi]KML25016.1 teichoic acid transporter [Rossellomorea marisflavi]